MREGGGETRTSVWSPGTSAGPIRMQKVCQRNSRCCSIFSHIPVATPGKRATNYKHSGWCEKKLWGRTCLQDALDEDEGLEILSNMTAPRLRALQNGTSQKNQPIRGKKGNRTTLTPLYAVIRAQVPKQALAVLIRNPHQTGRSNSP